MNGHDCLCKVCVDLPRCEACKIFLDDKPDIDGICEVCYGFEKFIKDKCPCGKPLKNSRKRYIKKGNLCDGCIHKVNILFPRL